MKLEIREYNQAGVTLIETIVYLALFAVLVGGFFTAVADITQSQNSLREKAFIRDSAAFVLAKISWALTGDIYIAEPLLGNSSDLLQVWRNNLAPAENPFSFYLDSGVVMQGRGGDANTLTSARYSVSGLSFSRALEFGREYVVAEFDLGGTVYQRKFYLNH